MTYVLPLNAVSSVALSESSDVHSCEGVMA